MRAGSGDGLSLRDLAAASGLSRETVRRSVVDAGFDFEPVARPRVTKRAIVEAMGGRLKERISSGLSWIDLVNELAKAGFEINASTLKKYVLELAAERNRGSA